MDKFNTSEEVQTNSSAPRTVCQKIGYGLEYNPTSSQFEFLIDETYQGSTEYYRMFTWRNIAKSMARTIISMNGMTAETTAGPFGNFSSYYKPTNNNARIVSLGHDTNSGTDCKPDYIDLLVYELAKTEGPDYDTTIPSS